MTNCARHNPKDQSSSVQVTKVFNVISFGVGAADTRKSFHIRRGSASQPFSHENFAYVARPFVVMNGNDARKKKAAAEAGDPDQGTRAPGGLFKR